jgi:TM2 domain-containing membrane protein YozV
MTKSLKAALLSGLVCPGLGQIFLHRYRRGIILIALVLAGFTCIIVTAMGTALALMQQLELQGEAIDIATISRLAAQSTTSASTLMYIGLFVIVCCWLFAILDACWIGKAGADQAN